MFKLIDKNKIVVKIRCRIHKETNLSDECQSGSDADTDAVVLFYESAGRGDLALLVAGLRPGLALNVGGGPLHAVRMAR